MRGLSSKWSKMSSLMSGHREGNAIWTHLIARLHRVRVYCVPTAPQARKYIPTIVVNASDPTSCATAHLRSIQKQVLSQLHEELLQVYFWVMPHKVGQSRSTYTESQTQEQHIVRAVFKIKHPVQNVFWLATLMSQCVVPDQKPGAGQRIFYHH